MNYRQPLPYYHNFYRYSATNEQICNNQDDICVVPRQKLHIGIHYDLFWWYHAYQYVHREYGYGAYSHELPKDHPDAPRQNPCVCTNVPNVKEMVIHDLPPKVFHNTVSQYRLYEMHVCTLNDSDE